MLYFLSEWFGQKDTFLEFFQKSKTELFAKIVDGFRRLTIFVKRFILDVGLGTEYASTDRNPLLISLKNEAVDLFVN